MCACVCVCVCVCVVCFDVCVCVCVVCFDVCVWFALMCVCVCVVCFDVWVWFVLSVCVCVRARAQTAVSLQQTTQIMSVVSFITAHVAYASTNKSKKIMF